MRLLREYWPLLMLWGAVAGALGAGTAMWFVARGLRAATRALSNVIYLPPCAERSGPTHVVRKDPVFDFDREPA